MVKPFVTSHLQIKYVKLIKYKKINNKLHRTESGFFRQVYIVHIKQFNRRERKHWPPNDNYFVDSNTSCAIIPHYPQLPHAI